MSALYNPDPAAYSNPLDSIKLLSQRDLSLRVPINFVPVAGVSLTSACFFNGRYETQSAAKCFSNLLTTGYRRLVLDLYWDQTRNDWSFCPVQLGNVDNPGPSSTSSFAGNRTSSISATSSHASLTVREELEARQTRATLTFSSMSLSSSLASSIMAPSATTSISPSSPTSTATTSSDDLIVVGPYTCQATTDLALFFQVLLSYLDATNNNLNATTTYLSLNVHAAAAASDPTSSPPAPTRLPTGNSWLSSKIAENATDYLYTPSNLIQQRSDLNISGSWFSVPQNVAPDPAYFELINVDGRDTTPDGWPSESFIEFTKTKRLLVAFGNIDSKVYNISVDGATIFTRAGLTQTPRYSLMSNGPVQSGCFFQPLQTNLANVNNSWAVADTVPASPQLYQAQCSNLTSCGYTPLLNQTIGNASAATGIGQYHDFVMATIWSWAPNEPSDASEPNSSNNHCATLNATSGYWQVDECNNYHYGACRIGDEPYQWQIGSGQDSYGQVDQQCATNTSFTVSRTALENDYLLNMWRIARQRNSINDELLWLNFNDLDVTTCWVIGQNTTCPYQDSGDDDERIIVVPLVAGIIILVVLVLTILTKCAANRQNTRRRRRRGDDGWDYEGVPS